MFIGVADADLSCLRQGDILRDIPFPRLASAEISLLGKIIPDFPPRPVPVIAVVTNTHRDDPNWLVAQIPVRLSYCAVITQCCDLELRNGTLRMPAFAVARLITIPKSIASDPQRLTSLRGNKDPRSGTDPGYINFFHIPAHPQMGSSEWIVDYNQVVSIPGREFPAVLTRKILQMEDDWRVKFKIKLALCLARMTDEERKAGIEIRGSGSKRRWSSRRQRHLRQKLNRMPAVGGHA